MTVLLAAVPGQFEDLGSGGVYWWRWDGAERRLLTRFEAGVLSTSATFLPRDAHLARIAALGVDRNAAGASFDQLVAQDLIVGPEWYLRDAGAAPPRSDPPPPLLVVRSYERPEGLTRLLDSLVADQDRHGATRDVAIVDDTRDAARARDSARIVTAFARRNRGRTLLLGLDERAAALEQLARASGVEPGVLSSLLDPAVPSAVTGSRTWNWAVLLSAGGTLSILDDDVFFPLRVPEGRGVRYEFADSTEPVVRFFDDESWREADELEGEPFRELSRWLGQGTAHLVARDGWRADALPHSSPTKLLHLREDAPVVGVVPGTYGSMAFNSSVYLLHSNPPTQASLFRAPYRHERLEADRLWYGYPHPRLISNAVYTPLLLDNRALLPFAGTWGRVDDTYFLRLLDAIASPVAFAHVPAMLGHADFAPRNRLARAAQPLLLDRNVFFAHLFAGLAPGLRGRSRAERLAAVGEVCATLAAAADAELALEVLRFRTMMLGQVLRQLQAGQDAHRDAPAQWRDTVASAIAVNRAELVSYRPADEELATLRRGLVQVASASRAWPALWHAFASDPGLRERVCVVCSL